MDTARPGGLSGGQPQPAPGSGDQAGTQLLLDGIAAFTLPAQWRHTAALRLGRWLHGTVCPLDDVLVCVSDLVTVAVQTVPYGTVAFRLERENLGTILVAVWDSGWDPRWNSRGASWGEAPGRELVVDSPLLALVDALAIDAGVQPTPRPRGRWVWARFKSPTVIREIKEKEQRNGAPNT